MKFRNITTPITKPVNDTVETVQNTITAVNGSVNKNFVDQQKSALGSVKENFKNHVYDAEGKGIISSQADPMVAPLNHTLEQFVDNHFLILKVQLKVTLVKYREHSRLSGI